MRERKGAGLALAISRPTRATDTVRDAVILPVMAMGERAWRRGEGGRGEKKDRKVRERILTRIFPIDVGF